MNKSVYAKILAAQLAVNKVIKTGKNAQQDYKYATEVDMLDAARPALLDAGLAVFASVDSSDVQTMPMENKYGKTVLYSIAKVVMKYTVADIETGETVEAFSHGYAHDTGDKAIYKATTGASKYFFFKFLGIGTTDDPETATGEIEKPTPKQAYKKPQAVASPTAEPTKSDEYLVAIKDIMSEYDIATDEAMQVTGLATLQGLSEEELAAAVSKLDAYGQELRKGAA